MRWIDNEKSENYLVGYSNEDRAYVVITKKDTKNGIVLQLHIRKKKGFVPVPLSVDPEEITMEMVRGWYSLEDPKILGRDDGRNDFQMS